MVRIKKLLVKASRGEGLLYNTLSPLLPSALDSSAVSTNRWNAKIFRAWNINPRLQVLGLVLVSSILISPPKSGMGAAGLLKTT